jgi:hypothetical protein
MQRGRRRQFVNATEKEVSYVDWLSVTEVNGKVTMRFWEVLARCKG